MEFYTHIEFHQLLEKPNIQDIGFVLFVFRTVILPRKLYQKLKVLYIDRTHESLSNGRPSGSISCFHSLVNSKSYTESRFSFIVPSYIRPQTKTKIKTAIPK